MICILGCLDTKNGLIICKEMRSWLDTEHDVFEVHQEPPGKLFEYPAIKCAVNAAITVNEPVLYLHTKGAYNLIPTHYKVSMMAPCVNFPKEAKPEDCQRIVRNMWKHEFTGESLQQYIKEANVNEPRVVCPFTGPEKYTWQNGFIINPSAAKEIKKFLKLETKRHYYETMLKDKPTIKVIGIRNNNIKDTLESRTIMWNYIWQFI